MASASQIATGIAREPQSPINVAASPRWDEGWRAYAILGLLCAALYLPGMVSTPPVDRDEAYFAQSTRQMLATGDYVRPLFLDRERDRKPIGIYWLQAASVMLTGERATSDIWPYRLPSVIGAAIAVMLTYWVGVGLFRPRDAMLGAALLAASALMVVQAGQGKTDAPLLASLVWAQGCLACVYRAAGQRRRAPARYAAGFWIAQGAGILLKGPVLPLVSASTILALVAMDRWLPRDEQLPIGAGWLRELRWWWGLPLMLAMILPWMIAVGILTNWRFFVGALSDDMLPKLTRSYESHGGPPGYYFLVGMASFWPGSILAGVALIRGVREYRSHGERFCLAWLVPTWLIFELIPTKLPHYVLPVFPALAILTARFITAPAIPAFMRRLARAEAALWMATTVIIGAGFSAIAIKLGEGFSALNLLTFSSALLVAIGAGYASWSGRLTRAAWIGVVGAVAVFAPLRQWIIPNLGDLWPSRAAAEAIAHVGAVGKPLAILGNPEPSLVFSLNAQAVFDDPRSGAAFLERKPDAMLIAIGESAPAFEKEAGRRNLRVLRLWSGHGFDYSKRWRRVELILFARQPESH